LDDETRREIMRKNLCFTCRDMWVLGHICMGKGHIQFIEVELDSDEVEEEIISTPYSGSEEEHAHEEGRPPKKPQPQIEP
jgi:hypothetical protein